MIGTTLSSFYMKGQGQLIVLKKGGNCYEFRYNYIFVYVPNGIVCLSFHGRHSNVGGGLH